MPKYRTEFKVKLVKEYLKSSISYKYLSEKYCIPDKILAIRWVNDFRKQGIEGLKPKKRARPSSMTKGFKSLYKQIPQKTQREIKKNLQKR